MYSTLLRYALIFFSCSLPCITLAQNQEPSLPAPWALQVGWWSALMQGSNEEVESRVHKLVQSLGNLEGQVPEESKEVVRSAVERVSLNIKQFLALRVSEGWLINPSPTLQDVYTIDDYMLSARELSSNTLRVRDEGEALKGLEDTHVRTLRQVDELYDDYADTEEQSLQRTLTGLELMVAISTRAIIEEQIRIKRERLAGIEKQEIWSKKVLDSAEERLSPTDLDEARLEQELRDAKKKATALDLELLEIETGLAVGGPVLEFDLRPLAAMRVRVSLERTAVRVYLVQAKKGILRLSEEGLNSESVHAILEDSKSWLQGLAKGKEHVLEWQAFIRKEQDQAERAFLRNQDGEKVNKESRFQPLLEHQRLAQEILLAISELESELFQAKQLALASSRNAIKRLDLLSGLWTRSYYLGEVALSETVEGASYPLFRINDHPVSALKIFWSICVFLLAWGADVIFNRAFTAFCRKKKHVSSASLYTFTRVTHYAILFLGVVFALGVIGIDFSKLLIIAGALSVGIGFGLQGIVNNFLSGIIVLFDRKLRVGDFVELSSGQMGHLTEVNVQNTVIRSLRGHDILVPNSDIITRQLSNWTLRDRFARFHFEFGIAYGSDKELVKEVVEKSARQLEETLVGHRKYSDPVVLLVGFGDSSLDFELVVWVDLRRTTKRLSSLRSTYLWQIETVLKENGIEIPFPQRDLHIKTQAPLA